MRSHLGVDVKRYAQYWTAYISGSDYQESALFGTPLAITLWMCYCDVSPDCQDHR